MRSLAFLGNDLWERFIQKSTPMTEHPALHVRIRAVIVAQSTHPSITVAAATV